MLPSRPKQSSNGSGCFIDFVATGFGALGDSVLDAMAKVLVDEANADVLKRFGD